MLFLFKRMYVEWKLKVGGENWRLTCRVLSLRPFRKMGKLTKLLYFVTTSERDAKGRKHRRRCVRLQLRRFLTFNSVLGGELFAVLLEMQHDLGSLLNATGFSDFIQSRAEGDNEEDNFNTNAVASLREFY